MLNLLKNKEKQNKEYCLIGLSKFNYETGLILVQEGHKVTVVDIDEKIINTKGKDFDYAIVSDCTDIEELEDLGIQFFDYVILGISDIAASVTIASNLKELNVKKILAKSKNLVHTRILKAMGINLTFIPEVEIAEKIAYKTMYELNIELFSFDGISKNTFIIRTPVYNQTIWLKKVSEISFLKSIAAKIISIKRKNDEVIVPVLGSDFINRGDYICLICKKEHIKQIKGFFGSNYTIK